MFFIPAESDSSSSDEGEKEGPPSVSADIDALSPVAVVAGDRETAKAERADGHGDKEERELKDDEERMYRATITRLSPTDRSAALPGTTQRPGWLLFSQSSHGRNVVFILRIDKLLRKGKMGKLCAHFSRG